MNDQNPHSLLHTVYDLAIQPADTRYIDFLSEAATELERSDATSMIVCIVPSEDSADADQEFWQAKNILVPATNFIPNLANPMLFASRRQAEKYLEECGPLGFPENALKANSESFTIGDISLVERDIAKASSEALSYVEKWLEIRSRGRDIVSVTLSGNRPEDQRVAVVDNLIAIARDFNAANVFPVIVPDFEHHVAGDEYSLEGMAVYSEAGVNIQLLAALYQLSVANIMAWDGPHEFCRYNAACRYLILKDDFFPAEVTNPDLSRGRLVQTAPGKELKSMELLAELREITHA